MNKPLTEAGLKLFAAYARISPGPCPWNPFPRDSAWGQQIEALYRDDQLKRRARLAEDRP